MRLASGTSVSRRTKRTVIASSLLALFVAIAFAGTGGAKIFGSTSSAKHPTTNANKQLVKQSKALLAAMTSGLVQSPKLASNFSPNINVSPADIKPMKTWAGPTAVVTPPLKANIQLISCAAGTACDFAAENLAAIAKSLGWDAEIIKAAGTPQSFIAAFQTALSRNPDAIIGIAVPDAFVGAQLAEARKRGIFTGALASTPSGSDRYDSYVTVLHNLMFAMNAFAAIASTDGHVKAIVVHDKGQSALDDGAKIAEKIIRKCGGCKTYPVTWTLEQAQNPVRVTAIVSAALRSHPDANVIILPYESSGLAATVEAVRQTGRSGKIKIFGKDATPPALQALKGGQFQYDAGGDFAWTAYIMMDQVVRGLAKAPSVPSSRQGFPLHMFTRANAPKDGHVDLGTFVAYKAKYLQLWGK